MIKFVYSLLFYLITPFIFLRLFIKSRKSPAYRKRWSERLGFIPSLSRKRPVIWVHSVSVGETIASAPMVKALQQHYPHYQLFITTMTPTGSERVTALYSQSVEHSYIPYDLPCALARFLKRVNPAMAIIIETELWPNTINACYSRGIPIILANARLSEKSAQGYARLGHLTRTMLQQFNMIACQHNEDGNRFLRLGLPKTNLCITGSIKFDIKISAQVQLSAEKLRASWEKGFGRAAQVFIAGSTHAGEDSQIIDAFIKLKKQEKNLILVLAPRHPERFQKTFELAVSKGLVVVRHSLNDPVSSNTDVILGDTIGEMMKLFIASDIAFVGGSLVEAGGHNILEPAAAGLPVLSGTYTFNFQEIASALEKAGGLIRIKNSEDLFININKLLKNKAYYNHTCTHAKQFVENNRGALDNLLNIISQQIASAHENGKYGNVK